MFRFLEALEGIWHTSVLPRGFVHQLANVSKASTPFRVFDGALTPPCFFFRQDSVHDGGLAIFRYIFLNVRCGIAKAITNQLVHFFTY